MSEPRSEPLRVGVIGAGAIAFTRHLPGYQACEKAGTARLVAVCDPVESSARRAAAQFGIPRVFADYRDLLEIHDLDAVSVSTPNATHEPIALAALERGLHVMCEKPLALDYAGARRMFESAQRAGRTTGVNFGYRWVPAAGFVRDLIQGGELGEIYHIFMDYFDAALHDPASPARWREQRSQAGSGALGDIASHLVDLCRFWIGEIVEVTGHLRTFTAERPLAQGGVGRVDVDDAATFLVQLASGAEGVFNASHCAIGWADHQRAEIYGTRGAVIYEIDGVDRGGDRVQLCLRSARERRASFAPVKVPPRYLPGTPGGALVEFVDASRAGREATPSFRDGMICQGVLDAVEVSARERRPVRPLRN